MKMRYRENNSGTFFASNPEGPHPLVVGSSKHLCLFTQPAFVVTSSEQLLQVPPGKGTNYDHIASPSLVRISITIETTLWAEGSALRDGKQQLRANGC